MSENAGNHNPKTDYIERAEVGTILAFNVRDDDNEAVSSGELLRRNISKKLLMVGNPEGEPYIVKFEDVLWVKTGRRWPKGVYELLNKNKVR